MPEKKQIEAKVIYKAWKALEKDTNIILLYGGAGAGKSYAVAQWLIIQACLREKEKHILITRKTNPSLRLSCWQLILSLLEKYEIPHYVHVSDQVIMISHTKARIYFKGLDDPEKIKSAEFNYIWMEEATEFDFEDYVLLKLRLRRKSIDKKPNKLIMTFNPVPSWIKEYFFDEQKEKDAHICKLIHKDNPFLPPDYIERLEELKAQNPAFYQIYALGEFAEPETLIYPKYSIDPEVPSIEQCERVVYGVDFGYNNPTAVLRVGFNGKKLYVLDEIYQSHMTNADLIEALKSFVKPRNALVACDSAEPGRIEELRRAGFNAIPAIKNVLDGINKVKEFELHIARHCENTIKEIKMYSWKKDKKGNTLDEPVKFNDHAMDALRYAVATAMQHTDVAILNKEEWGVW